jgi:hypothetical protein
MPEHEDSENCGPQAQSRALLSESLTPGIIQTTRRESRGRDKEHLSQREPRMKYLETLCPNATLTYFGDGSTFLSIIRGNTFISVKAIEFRVTWMLEEMFSVRRK